MTAEDRGRAQRWHETDHGEKRGKPLRSNRFRVAVQERDREWVSACWCCCEQCDPSWGHLRPNPFWTRAKAA